jgi:predicted phosphate transport protein (TIGR00153 family)
VKLRLIPRDDGFYPLFKRQVAIVAEAVGILAAETRDYREPAAASAKLRDLEHAGDDLNHEITRRLEQTFVTPFDRDAIHHLASGLDDILDLVEEVADKFVLYHVAAPPDGAADMAELLARSCAVLVEAIDHLDKPATLRPYPIELHRIEKEGDALVRSLIQRLFDGATDIRPLLIGKEIYDGLEDALDRTDHVGRVLEGVALSVGPGPTW